MNFHFFGNNKAIDLVNTESAAASGTTDLLASQEALSDWFEEAGIACGIQCSDKDLEETRELRSAMRRIFDRVQESKSAAPGDLDLLNRRSNEMVRLLSAANNNFKISVRLNSSTDILAMLASQCCELLASNRLGSIRKCASTKCTYYFFDTSKNQQRQWCSMETCGNRHKMRKHYDRSRGDSS
ncbi:MAG TPA: CGNR zinc finger domain-containing protein [Candidatus Melainabacteria bacterium]|nr:CGNR zinc finger domain-containing protein [Candidatus Melainabacteria bacterium]